MERDNFEISQELEQMREQFRILTEKVEKQNIVYDKQLRGSMRRRMNSYNFWEVWIEVILIIPLCYLLYVITIQRTGMPSWTTVMLCAYCVISIAYLLIKKMMQDRLLDYKGNLRLFADNVRKVKRWHRRSFLCTMPISLTFVTLFCTEYFKTLYATTEIVIISVIILIIGMIINTFVSRSKERILDNIIKEIEE